MSVAVRQTPDWKQWEGDIAGGEFPLEQFLGGGEKSAVFRTRLTSGSAAIKLVPAAGVQAEELIERWTRAQALNHPHLIRIVRTGTWANAGLSLAYLVMEYADENLAAVLLERTLTADETLEMLQPVAEALAFLHRQGLVQGRLRPSNIFAVNDTLKLSRDAVSAGDASADMRALASTTVQTLTREAVTFSNGSSETNVVGSLPRAFQEIVRNCSGQDGRIQWSAADLASWLRSQPGAAQSANQSANQRPAQVPGSSTEAPAMRVSRSRTRTPRLTYYAIVLALMLVAVVTLGSLLSHRTADSIPAVPQPPAKTLAPAPSASPPTALPKRRQAEAAKSPAPVRASHAQPAVSSPEQIALQVLPDIPEKARRTIHGTVVIVIRATVNQSGDVTDASLQPTGSQYLGRLALEAVRKWRFVPGNSAAPQEWRVRFEITRAETKAFPQRSPGP
jgi:TonB family protein